MTKWYILGSIFNGVDFYLNFTSCGTLRAEATFSRYELACEK